MNPEKQEVKGNKPTGEFQGDMLDATKPLIDAVPEIGSMFGSALLSPLAFFF